MRYRGTNRNANHVSGFTTASPDDFVAAKYRAGWRSLYVEDTSRPAEDCLVGQIYQTAKGRQWWAECLIDNEPEAS